MRQRKSRKEVRKVVPLGRGVTLNALLPKEGVVGERNIYGRKGS